MTLSQRALLLAPIVKDKVDNTSVVMEYVKRGPFAFSIILMMLSKIVVLLFACGNKRAIRQADLGKKRGPHTGLAQ